MVQVWCENATHCAAVVGGEGKGGRWTQLRGKHVLRQPLTGEGWLREPVWYKRIPYVRAPAKQLVQRQPRSLGCL